MNDKRPADELLKLYNQIDAFLRNQRRSDRHAEHGYLIQQIAKTNRTVARFQSELRAIAKLRNNIVHNPLMDIAAPIAYPHPLLVERYRHIRDALLDPPRALSIAVPGHKIYTATLTTPLSEVLQKMNDNIFTHVPIMEDSQMMGIFSENTLISYLADKPNRINVKEMTIGDFKSYLPLKGHKGEHFAFLPRKAALADVYDIFNQAIKAHKRIGMIFITKHGGPNERPLGIITAWDLASPEFELR